MLKILNGQRYERVVSVRNGKLKKSRTNKFHPNEKVHNNFADVNDNIIFVSTARATESGDQM